MITDTYECSACNPEGAACRVIIKHTDDDMPEHLQGLDKFRNRVCICRSAPDSLTDWRKVSAPAES